MRPKDTPGGAHTGVPISSHSTKTGLCSGKIRGVRRSESERVQPVQQQLEQARECVRRPCRTRSAGTNRNVGGVLLAPAREGIATEWLISLRLAGSHSSVLWYKGC